MHADPGVGADALSDLYFHGLIRSYTDASRFVRREWWVGEITAELDNPAGTYLVLTAEPGAGKTALMAQLSQDHPDWPRYFLRRDQQQPLADSSARAVLLRLGLQLATRRPELFPPPAGITVDQHVGTVHGGGQVVGIEVDKLVASPFRQIALGVRQQVAVAGGQVVGLRIGQWIADLEFVPISDLATMALQEPLMQASAQGGADVVILLDAIDEAAEAAGQETILDWLAAAPAFPDNLKVVVTSRPNPQVTIFAARQRDRVRPLTFDPSDPRVQEDLRAYARDLADAGPTRTALAKAGRPADDFIRESLARAEGNIGYLAAIGRTVDQAANQPELQADLESLIMRRGLPVGLQGLYRYFLGQLRVRTNGLSIRVEDPDSGRQVVLGLWSEIYQPLLEAFATAFADLAADELIGLTGTWASLSELSFALGRLAHLLDEDHRHYRFFHATVAEFLTDPATACDPETAEFAVDAMAVYRRIGRNLARMVSGTESAPAGPGLRRYALAFAPGYLLRASQGGEGEYSGPRAELRRLLTDLPFMESKVSEIGVQAALADLAGAAQLLTGEDGAVRRIHLALAGEAGNLQTDQKGDPYHLGNPYFGHWEGDVGRRDRFHAPWLSHAGFVLHQLLNAAVFASDVALADAVRAELQRRSLPYLELQWAVTASPPRVFDSGPRDARATARIVAVSPDGQWVLTHSLRGGPIFGEPPALTVWDTETGEHFTIPTMPADIDAKWAVTADGETAISGTGNGQITVWHLRDSQVGNLPRHGEILRPGPGPGITALAVADNGAWVAAADETGDLQACPLAAGPSSPQPAHRPMSSVIAAMAVVSGDRGVGYVTRDGHVGTWELDGLPTPAGIAPGTAGQLAGSIALSPDGQWAAVGSEGGVHVINLRNPLGGKTLTAAARSGWDNQNANPGSLAFLPGSLAVAGIYPGRFDSASTMDLSNRIRGDRIVVWELGSGQVLADYTLETGWSGGCLTSRAARVFAAGFDGSLAGWRLDQAHHGQEPHDTTVTGIAVAGQGDRAVSVAADEEGLRSWQLGSVPSSEWLPKREGPPGYGQLCVALSAEGTRAVSGYQGGLVAVWELGTGHASILSYGYQSSGWGNPRPDPTWVKAVAISADGRRAVSNRARRDELILWDLTEMAEIDRLKGFALRCLAMTPDLRYGISGGDQPAWWDMPEHRCTLLPTSTQGQPGVGPVGPVPVTAVAITSDGAWGAVGYADGAVWLWDLNNGPRQAGQLSAHAMGVHGLAFLAGSTQLVSASGDRTVAVWDTDTGRELARAAFFAPLRSLAASGDRVLVGDATGSVYYCRWRA